MTKVTDYAQQSRSTAEQRSNRERLYELFRRFRLTFDLRGMGPVRALRWDPLEGYWCSVRLTGASCYTSDGRSIVVDLTTVRSNGTARADGTVVFETFDPIFLLPIEGDVASVILQGDWERSETPQLIASLEARFRETSQREKEEVLADCATRLQDEERALKASCQRELERAANDHELRMEAKQAELESVVSEYELQLHTKRAELERVAAEYERLLNQKQAELQGVVAEYEEQCNTTQAELETILRSRSWRLTAPLRAVRRKLTRQRDVDG